MREPGIKTFYEYDFGWDDSGDHRAQGSCLADKDGWSLEAMCFRITINMDKVHDHDEAWDRARDIAFCQVREDDYEEGESREHDSYVLREDIDFDDPNVIVSEEKNSPWDKAKKKETA